MRYLIPVGTGKDFQAETQEVLRSREKSPRELIPLLQEIQHRFGYLPPESLREVAKALRIPLSRVYGVATFYAQFSLTPKGKHLVRVCLGTACHVRGAPQVLEELRRQLEVGDEGISEDGLVSLETVRCVGACALGPVVVVDEEYWGRMAPARVEELVRTLREKDAEA